MYKLWQRLALIPFGLFLVMSLTGCASVAAAIFELPDGRVIQIIRAEVETQAGLLDLTAVYNRLKGEEFGLHENRIENMQIYDEEGKLVTFTYGKDVDLRLADSELVLELEFDNRESFLYFNELDARNAQPEVDIVWRTFFVERTITMQNPFQRFLEGEGNRTMALIQFFNEELSTSDEEITLAYHFGSSFRRTSSNATYVERFADGWMHIFVAESIAELDDIIIFDRFANTPAWYGVGVGATALFMIVLWMLLRPRTNLNQNNAGQN